MKRLGKFLLTALLLAAILPPSCVLLLRFVPPVTSAYMLQSPVRPVEYRWVGANRIADVMRKAAVASEDQRFWNHKGFDVEAMQKAYQQNQKRRKIRGGSTISQQTAKNLFLWPGGGYLRKGIEATLTVLIEAFWPKQRILEVYLNIAEFGPGVYGVEAAAQKFFGKPAAQLSAAEAARLASVLPSPRRWRAAAPGPYVQQRTAWILRQMGYGPRPAEDEEPIEDLQEALRAEELQRELQEGLPADPLPAPAEEPVPESVEGPEAPAADAAPDSAPPPTEPTPSQDPAPATDPAQGG
jgi:monofunctional biosynthetic peptidoglycan transglycosylase